MFKIFVICTVIATISKSTHQQNEIQVILVPVEQILKAIANASTDEKISHENPLNAAAVKFSDVEMEKFDALQADTIDSKFLVFWLLNKFTTTTEIPTTTTTSTTTTTTTTTTTLGPSATGRDNLDYIE